MRSCRVALVRTILAALIAVSVALSPAIGEAVMSPSPVEMAMGDQAGHALLPMLRYAGPFQIDRVVLKCVTLAGAILSAVNVAQRYLLMVRLCPLWMTHRVGL